MKYNLYLAGPINALNDSDAKDWRQLVMDELADDYNFLDPMTRDFRGIEGDHTAEIVEGDLEDIRNCDVFLANSWKPSYGTAMEIFYAHHVLDKMVLVVAPRPHSPWLTYHADWVFGDLDSAIHELKTSVPSLF